MIRTARSLLPFALAIVAFASPSRARAQAWVPTEMSLSLSLEYAFVFSEADVFQHEVMLGASGPLPEETTRFRKNAKVRTHLFIPTIDFTPLPNLGLKLWLPLIYSGCPEADFCGHRHPNMEDHVDDGKSRFTLQDLNSELRYMIDIEDVITFAPSLGFSFATNDYQTVGHAIVGRRRPQIRAGLNVGRGLTEIIPGAYIHGRYQFAYVFPLGLDAYEGSPDPGIPHAPDDNDRLKEIGINRSSFDVELGYFIYEDLSVRLTLHYETTHGGVEYTDVVADAASIVHRNHDVLGAERYTLFGGGLTYILLEEVFLSATFLKWIDGANTHDSDSLNFGIGYTVF